MSSSKQKQKLSGRTSCNTSFAHHSSPFLSLPFPSLSIPGRPGAIGLPRCAVGRHHVAQTERLGWREGSVVGADEGAGAGGGGCGPPPPPPPPRRPPPPPPPPAPPAGRRRTRPAPRGARRACSSAQTPQESAHKQRDRGSGGHQRRSSDHVGRNEHATATAKGKRTPPIEKGKKNKKKHTTKRGPHFTYPLVDPNSKTVTTKRAANLKRSRQLN